jgi:hypothetical protein
LPIVELGVTYTRVADHVVPQPVKEAIAPATSVSPATSAVSSGYNGSAAASYALRWWDTSKGHNGAFRLFDEDCTNFISQSLVAGGWHQQAGPAESATAWWYRKTAHKILPDHHAWSHTRTVADDLHSFASVSRRATISKTKTLTGGSLRVGDVVQADWASDGHIDHSMMVTGKDSTGQAWLTYHSVDTHYLPLTAAPGVDSLQRRVGAHYPNPTFYVTRIN